MENRREGQVWLARLASCLIMDVTLLIRLCVCRLSSQGGILLRELLQ